MKILRLILVTGFLLVGLANLAFFVFWYKASTVTMLMPSSPTGYSVEALALNVTILEIILVLVGFILAALGLFGYTEIKSAAVRAATDAAEREAKDTVSEQLRLLDAVRAKSDETTPEHAGSYGLGDQPTEGATPAKDE